MTDEYENELYAEDVSVNDTGPELVVEDLERKDFVKYAGASGDFNPIHYDEPYAKEAGNPSVFGQGMCTAGYTAHMVSDWFGLENIRKFGVRFRARVWPGDTVTVSGEVTDVTREDDHATVEAEIATENDDGDTLITGTVVAELPSRD
jgi:acyl dehydratase